MCLQQISYKSTAFVDVALTCDGILAAMALLGHIGLVAVHTVNLVLMGSETRPCKRFMAGVAHETFWVPGLVLIADSSRGDGLRGAEKTQQGHSFWNELKWNYNFNIYRFCRFCRWYLSRQEQTDKYFYTNIHDVIISAYTCLQWKHFLANFLSWHGAQ